MTGGAPLRERGFARLGGSDLWLDPNSAVTFPLQSDAQGESAFGLAPPTFAFGSLHSQFVWLENAGPLTLSVEWCRVAPCRYSGSGSERRSVTKFVAVRFVLEDPS